MVSSVSTCSRTQYVFTTNENGRSKWWCLKTTHLNLLKIYKSGTDQHVSCFSQMFPAFPWADNDTCDNYITCGNVDYQWSRDICIMCSWLFKLSSPRVRCMVSFWKLTISNFNSNRPIIRIQLRVTHGGGTSGCANSRQLQTKTPFHYNSALCWQLFVRATFSLSIQPQYLFSQFKQTEFTEQPFLWLADVTICIYAFILFLMEQIIST